MENLQSKRQINEVRLIIIIVKTQTKISMERLSGHIILLEYHIHFPFFYFCLVISFFLFFIFQFVLFVVCFMLTRFTAKALLERLRGKRLVFVGDSLNRGQWVSMVCLLESSIPSANKSMHTNGSLTTFKAMVITFFSPSILCTHFIRLMTVLIKTYPNYSQNLQSELCYYHPSFRILICDFSSPNQFSEIVCVPRSVSLSP